MEQEAHFTVQDRKTLQELSQTSAVLESKLDRVIEDVKGLINNFASKIEVAEIAKKVEGLEDNNRWIIRTILGVVILGVLSLIFIH